MQENIKTYNITDTIEFKIFPGTIGVCVSGGADSALLLYFILKYSNVPIHIFSVAAKDKKMRNTRAAINVIAKCAELTQNYNFVHHIEYVTSQTKENLFKLPNLYFNKNIIDMIYTGVTKNPPKHITDNFTLETLENDERDPDVVRAVSGSNWYIPWTNLNKQDLCSIYTKYNLIESLFPLTRSCEWINHDWPDPNEGHCGKCWWCEERMWGFGRL